MADPISGSGSGGGPAPQWFLRNQYAVIEGDITLLSQFETCDNRCPDCGGVPISGGGGDSGSGGPPPPPLPYTGPCTCPPGWTVIVDPITGAKRCRNPAFPFLVTRLCAEDPANPITHPPSGGIDGGDPTLDLHLLNKYGEFDVPGDLQIISKFCEDIPVCFCSVIPGSGIG